MPFDETAPIVGRSPEASRQLASRARRRVRLARPDPVVDLATQRRIVESFLAASRQGDFEALIALLHPDVVLHMDVGDRPRLAQPPISGARQVAEFLRSGAPIPDQEERGWGPGADTRGRPGTRTFGPAIMRP